MGKPALHIGLTLDGSVSAGAYIAGVLDYLFECLDNWTKAKESLIAGVPTHDVIIEVITGASGGGISAAVSLLSSFQNRYPVTPNKRDDEDYLKKNKLYDTWVNLNYDDDLIPCFMDPSDLDREKKVISFLNSSFIDAMVSRILKYDQNEACDLPNYIHPELKLVMSMSNLAGFKFNIDFKGCGSTDYGMTQHRDYGFFQIGKDYRGNGYIPLYPPSNIGMTELSQVAPATAAFPIGLAYRLVERKLKYIIHNPYLNNPGLHLIDPNSHDDPENNYAAYFVDGGMLNNEPFDIAEKLMQEGTSQQVTSMQKDKDLFNKTIIMVEPFPSSDYVSRVKEEKSLPSFTDIKKKIETFPYSLWQVLARIYSTMRSQLLFKEVEIQKAFDENDYSRFIIAPRRTVGSEIYNGSIAIACGALDGFSGFISKEFRRHDFFLGRANCQGFLKKYFCIPETTSNPIFVEGYKDIITRKNYQFFDEEQKASFLPIIPIIHWEEEPPYPYPNYDMASFDKHKPAILERLKSIGLISFPGLVPQRLFRLFFFFGKNKIYNKLNEVITQQLKKWKLLKG